MNRHRLSPDTDYRRARRGCTRSSLRTRFRAPRNPSDEIAAQGESREPAASAVTQPSTAPAQEQHRLVIRLPFDLHASQGFFITGDTRGDSEFPASSLLGIPIRPYLESPEEQPKFRSLRHWPAAWESEARVDAVLSRLLEWNVPITPTVVADHLAHDLGLPRAMAVTIATVDLSLYDGLLESKEDMPLTDQLICMNL